jgi:hypothetical protein
MMRRERLKLSFVVWPRAEALRRCLGCFLGDTIPVRLFAQDNKLLGVRSPGQPESKLSWQWHTE